MTETRSQNFTAIHRSSVKFRGGICRFKTFCMRILARKTLNIFKVFCTSFVSFWGFNFSDYRRANTATKARLDVDDFQATEEKKAKGVRRGGGYASSSERTVICPKC